MQSCMAAAQRLLPYLMTHGQIPGNYILTSLSTTIRLNSSSIALLTNTSLVMISSFL